MMKFRTDNAQDREVIRLVNFYMENREDATIRIDDRLWTSATFDKSEIEREDHDGPFKDMMKIMCSSKGRIEVTLIAPNGEVLHAS